LMGDLLISSNLGDDWFQLLSNNKNWCRILVCYSGPNGTTNGTIHSPVLVLHINWSCPAKLPIIDSLRAGHRECQEPREPRALSNNQRTKKPQLGSSRSLAKGIPSGKRLHSELENHHF
jgi:hypothetical protein